MMTGPDQARIRPLKQELASLEELQKIDLEILEQRKELQAIPNNLNAMRSDVAHIGAILEKEKVRLEEAEQWRQDREKESALQNGLMAKSKAKLQSARNEKEQKAAQREIDTIRKTIQEREEEAIKVMEAIEQYRNAIAEHKNEFGELEKQLQDSEVAGKARMAEMESAIKQVEERRAALLGAVPQRLLRLYERIQKRLGRAIVDAVDGHCTGCNIQILPQMYNELQSGEKLHQCANCFRILVYKPPGDVAE